MNTFLTLEWKWILDPWRHALICHTNMSKSNTYHHIRQAKMSPHYCQIVNQRNINRSICNWIPSACYYHHELMPTLHSLYEWMIAWRYDGISHSKNIYDNATHHKYGNGIWSSAWVGPCTTQLYDNITYSNVIMETMRAWVHAKVHQCLGSWTRTLLP